MRRGQLTLIVIVGLVMLIVLGLIYFVIASDAAQRSRSSIDESRFSREAVAPVREFVQGCLDNALASSLLILGKQGGVLYESQGGLVADVGAPAGLRVVSYDDYRVPYGLHAPRGVVSAFFYADPPDYPWPRFPLLTTDTNVFDYQGFFGFERLPPLQGEFENALPSVEGQLRAAVLHTLKSCLDFSQLQGIPATVAGEVTDVGVFLNLEDTAVVVNTTLEVRSQDGGSGTVLGQFTSRSDVRLRKVYDTIHALLGRDGTDIRANIQGFVADGIVSAVTSDIRPGDNLLVASDTVGLVGGQQYEFRVMLENRQPALVYIRTPTSTGICAGGEVARKGAQLLFNGTRCGRGVTIFPEVDQLHPQGQVTYYDPDEDEINVSFTLLQPGVTLADGQYYAVSALDGGLDVRVMVSERDNPNARDWQDVTLVGAALG